jgi:taurine dioxygenase
MSRTATKSAIELMPLTAAVGVEATNVDLRAVDDDDVAVLRAALVEHQVVVVRRQPLTPVELKAFFTRLGEITHGVIRTRSTCVEEPDVLVLETMNPGSAAKWHTDHAFLDEPPMAACLHAVQLPRVGGDTCFTSLFAAYDALSPAMQSMLGGLTAVHDTEHLLRRFAKEDRNVTPESLVRLEAVHPVVRTHPESGRKSLFYTGDFMTRIVELTEAESDAVIAFLRSHINQPRFQLRHHWELETFVMWDERSTLHCGVDDYNERRVMHRLMLQGDRPY